MFDGDLLYVTTSPELHVLPNGKEINRKKEKIM